MRSRDYLKRSVNSAAFLVAFILFNAIGGCGGDDSAGTPAPSEAGSTIAISAEQSLASIQTTLADLPTPQGVDEAVFSALKAELAHMLESQGVERFISSPPMLPGSQAQLSWDGDSNTLSWGYCCSGDYNQDSLVGVNDITPLGQNYLAQVPADPNCLLAVVDGNGNGQIEVADITPIGQNFQARVTGYNVYASAELKDYPSDAADTNGNGTLLGSVPFPEGPPPAGQRRMFSFAVSDPQPETYFWVRPTDGGSEGTPSSHYYLAAHQNQAPVAALTADPLSGKPPLAVTFDASASYDSDGEIVKYEWDWTGFIDGWQWVDSGTESTQQHEYPEHGTYGCVVRVTDADGATDMASAQVTVNELLGPVAAITANPLWGQPPLTVDFSAADSQDPDGTIEDYEWDLDGDGEFGETGSEAAAAGSASAQHTYTANGTYAAAVRVTDDDDATDSASIDIHVASGGGGSDWRMFGRDARRNRNSSLISAQTDDVKWTYNAEYIDWSSPAIAGDGTVYIGGSDKLYAITSDGSLKWSYTAQYAVDSSPAIGPDGTVYVGSHDCNIYAIKPDGTLKWSYLTGDIVWSSPVIASDGTVIVGSWDGTLYAMNPDGSLKWSFATGGAVDASPAIAGDGTVLFGSFDGKLYAADPDGSLKWTFNAGSQVGSSPAVGADGTVYVGSHGGNVYAIKPDGSLKWSYPTGALVYSSPAVADDGTVYVGSTDGNLYAIRPDGSAKWIFDLETGADSSPAIGGDGTVYIGGFNSKLYAVSPDGSLKWSYDTGAGIISSPAIAADGTLYVGCRDGNLYAF